MWPQDIRLAIDIRRDPLLQGCPRDLPARPERKRKPDLVSARELAQDEEQDGAKFVVHAAPLKYMCLQLFRRQPPQGS